MKTTNNGLLIFLILIQSLIVSCENEEISGDFVTDIDGNKYEIVSIGNQTWMAENLATTRLNDGTPLENISGDSEWSLHNKPAHCWYENNKELCLDDNSGALYNWHTVETGKLCPDGWHVPSKEEWIELVEFVGGMEEVENALKAAEGWSDGENGSNTFGFNVIPAGVRVDYGSNDFDFKGSHTSFWSTTKSEDKGDPNLRYDFASRISFANYVYFNYSSWRCGLSIRCVKD